MRGEAGEPQETGPIGVLPKRVSTLQIQKVTLQTVAHLKENPFSDMMLKEEI